MQLGETRRADSPEAQRQLGAELALSLPPGGVLFLEGELGSGKTTLTQGLAAALGVEGQVSSPTYALMQLYPAAGGQLLHVDAYRVRRADELYSMDFEQLVRDSRLSVVEWGQLFYADFPEAWLLRLTYAGAPAGDGRLITRVR